MDMSFALKFLFVSVVCACFLIVVSREFFIYSG
jgi:hypothetical protein